jgi:adenine/guanine phosphoribosyltransferase-like PRPP-binding protein
MIIQSCSHLKSVLDPSTRQGVIKKAIEELTPIAQTFDAVAFCGNSGALVAPIVADALNKTILLVRKSGIDCASYEMVEGAVASRYIIIDDLVCSGKTLSHIQRSINKYHFSMAECVGVYLYGCTRFSKSVFRGVYKINLLSGSDKI